MSQGRDSWRHKSLSRIHSSRNSSSTYLSISRPPIEFLRLHGRVEKMNKIAQKHSIPQCQSQYFDLRITPVGPLGMREINFFFSEKLLFHAIPVVGRNDLATSEPSSTFTPQVVGQSHFDTCELSYCVKINKSLVCGAQISPL